MNIVRTLAVAAAALLPVAASAATVSYTTTLPTATSNIVGVETSPLVYQNIAGNVIVGASIGGADYGDADTPWDDDVSLYSAVTADAVLTFGLGSPHSSIEMVWGSVDAHNIIEFTYGGAVVDTVTGSEVGVSTDGSVDVFATIVSDHAFDGMVFYSPGIDAFEFANLTATPVPVPAAGFLLMGGLAGLGAMRRRRR